MVAVFQNCGKFNSLGGSGSANLAASSTLIAASNPTILPPVAGAPMGAGVFVPPAGGGTGTNTMLISHYLNGKYGLCLSCPTHLQGMTLTEIQDALSALSGTSLYHYREIIEASRFFPAAGQMNYQDDLVTILKLYQAQNAMVMLTFGRPIPSWMNPEFTGSQISYNAAIDNQICFIPVGDTAWGAVKNNLSQAFGLMAENIWNDPRLDQKWMSTHITIDPFNEFDTLKGGPDCQAQRYATGKRAADLTGGIQYVLNSKHIPFIVTAPSTSSGSLTYIADFYANGGLGMANIHPYPQPDSTTTADDPKRIDNYVAFVIDFLTKVNALAPAPYKNNIVLGEFGMATQTSSCTDQVPGCTGKIMTGSAENQFLTKFYGSSELQALAPVRMNWVLMESTTQFDTIDVLHTYMSMGLLRPDTSPKPALYYYALNHDGVDLSADPQRFSALRTKITAALQTQGLASPPASVVSSFLKDLILGAATWDQLVVKYGPPDSCADAAGSQLCTIYQNLFQRKPDVAGMAYWRAHLTSNGLTPLGGFPASCWKHEIAKSTAGADCTAYLNQFAPRDGFNKIYGWVPSASCTLPQALPGGAAVSIFAPACFVFPSDAQTACPGDADPRGPQTSSEANLCRAYSELYNRAPDPAGFAYWSPQLNGESLEQMKQALLPGTLAGDCAAYKANYGQSAPSVNCSSSAATPIPTPMPTPAATPALAPTPAPTPVAGDPCASDSASVQICAAYQALYQRKPDASGLAYWKSRFTTDGVTPSSGYPMSCWKHEITKGTSTPADCATYLNQFGTTDSYGRIFNWVPSASCPLPTAIPGGTAVTPFSPACFVWPADAQQACPGSPDSRGVPTATEINLCRAYSELYNRAPDPEGYTYWSGQFGGKTAACMKQALAPGTGATDCAAYRARYGVNAASAACGGVASAQPNFGCN